MKLDEAIKHEEELVNEYEGYAKKIREKMKSEISLSNADDFDKYARQHRQLAEWLKELKKFREEEPCEDWCEVPSYEMTLEQARQAVRDLRKFVMDNHILPKLQPCEDLIDRAEAMTEIMMFAGNVKSDEEDVCIKVSDAVQLLRELPPVTPTRKKGHWIIVDDCEHFIAKCSECGQIEDSRMISKYPYCHCGAKMESEETICK